VTRPLRAIIVEDSENDAQLIVRALRKGGFDVDFRLVDTSDSMRAALREGKWDIVLSDHSMPHFSAPEALNILKEGGVTLPFIIISGSIGTELAVSLMRTGAHDWIHKDDISRLVPAVEREIEEAMTLQKHKAIIAVSEEKFRTLANSTTDWVYWIDPKGNCVFTSPSALEITGHRPEEFLSDPDLLIHMTHPDDRGRFQKHLTECTSPLIMAEPCEIEFRILKKDGDVRWMSHTCSPIVDKNNQYLGRRASNRDITNRMRAEELLRESGEKYRLLVETMNDVVFTLDLEGGIVDTSPTMKKIIGWSREELIGKPFSDFVYPDDIQRAEEEFLRAIQDVGRPLQIRIISLDGNLRWVRINALLIMKDGEPDNLLCTLSDITEPKKDELLLAVQSDILTFLTRSSTNLKETVDGIVELLKLATGFDAVGIRLLEGHDYPFIAATGYSDEFLLAENVLTVQSPEGGVCRDKDGNVSLECTCGLVLSGRTDPANPLFTLGGSAWTNDSLPLLDVPLEQDPRLHPRNRCIHVGFRSIALVPLRAGDKIMGMFHLASRRTDGFTDKSIKFFEGIGVSIGIALQRKQGEELLRESEKKYRLLVDSAAEAIIVAQDGMTRLVNPMVTAITGFSEQELMSEPFQLFAHPDDRVMLMGHHKRRLRGEAVPARNVFRLIAKDGSTKWLEMSGVSIEWEGRPATMNFMTDITERKLAEEALRLKDLAISSSINAIAISDMSGNLTDVNPAFLKIWGQEDRQEVLGRSVLSFWKTPDQAQQAMERIQVHGSWSGEMIGQRKDGAQIDVQVSANLVHDSSGTPVALMAAFMDITERKRAEEALQLKNLVFQASIAANSIADLSGNITEANGAFLRIWGYPSKDEVTGKPLPHFFDEPNEAVAIVTALNDSGEWEGDFTAKRKDGSTFIAHGLATTVKNENGNVIGYQSAAIDVTERKRAEHDANERMKELRAFYYLAEIVAREGIALEEVYRELVGVLPESWQYPEITCARIAIGGEQFCTENYGESVWKQSASIKVNGVARGTIEIRYLEERPEEDEGPFLKEERLLIDAIGERLGRVIEQRVAEEALVKRTGEAEDAKVKTNAYFDFLAHDISNLLTPVMAYAEMISFDAETPGPSKRKADRIVGQMRRATSFILSLRRLQDVELLTQERMESRDLGTILDQAVTRVKAEYEDKRISATVVHAAEQVGFMGGKHLEDIIVGVLENSVEAAERDDLALEVKATLVRENDHKFLMLELMDDGPGIKDDLKMCFSVSEDPRKRFAVGTHRGVASSLVIGSAIVSQLGGELWIENRIPGDCSKGSRIVIKFPEEGFFGT
jgi:PAS domain S-box-containing protein